MGKNVFIIYSHQEPTSFNHALLEAGKKGLMKAGHNVKVSDLYAMKWNPVLGRHDITGKSKEDVFEYTMESATAAEEGRMASDIKAEHEKIKWADLIIFQFPLHWNAFPAMLKGYVDRVFTENFVFAFPDSVLDRGLLKGKTAMLSCTVGIPFGWYTNSAAHGDIEVSLWPIQNGLLNFSGCKVLYPELKYGPLLITQEERVKMLEDWTKRCESLFDEKPMTFPSFDDFHSPGGDSLYTFELKPEIKEQYKWVGLNPGQHLGKAFPKETQCKFPK